MKGASAQSRPAPDAGVPVASGAAPAGPDRLKLPPVGIGCWAFGGGAYWGGQDQTDVDRVVARALDAGLNYFDTAEVYNDGASEESLGRSLAGRRDRALIGTKVSPIHAYPATLREHCEASLRRLRTDRIDLYMIHWPLNGPSLRHFTADEALICHPPGLAAALQEMERLRSEGKIRHIGLSNFGLGQLGEAVAVGPRIEANEIPYNLLMRAAEHAVLPYCAREGIAVIGYSALMQGLLARPVETLEGLPPVRLRTRHFGASRTGSRHGEPGIEVESLRALRAIARIADDTGRPMAELALAWAVANGEIKCTLVGCRNVSQLEANLPALSRPLASGTRRQLEEVTAEVRRLLGERIDYFQSESETRSW